MGQRDEAQWAAEEYTIFGQEPTIDAIVGLLIDSHPDNIKRARHGFSAAGLE